jgi:hypothetical protein
VQVCLHLFGEARRIETELQQAVGFLFWQGVSKREDMISHINAAFEPALDGSSTGAAPHTAAAAAAAAAAPLCDVGDLQGGTASGSGSGRASSDQGSDTANVTGVITTPVVGQPEGPSWLLVNSLADDHVSRNGGAGGDGDGDGGVDDDARGEVDDELIAKKRLYLEATSSLARHRGVLRAVHDARDTLKAICNTPRHPEGRRPLRLYDIPRSLYVDPPTFCLSTGRRRV